MTPSRYFSIKHKTEKVFDILKKPNIVLHSPKNLEHINQL
jgi:hypothetical protein